MTISHDGTDVACIDHEMYYVFFYRSDKDDRTFYQNRNPLKLTHLLGKNKIKQLIKLDFSGKTLHFSFFLKIYLIKKIKVIFQLIYSKGEKSYMKIKDFIITVI